MSERYLGDVELSVVEPRLSLNLSEVALLQKLGSKYRVDVNLEPCSRVLCLWPWASCLHNTPGVIPQSPFDLFLANSPWSYLTEQLFLTRISQLQTVSLKLPSSRTLRLHPLYQHPVGCNQNASSILSMSVGCNPVSI